MKNESEKKMNELRNIHEKQLRLKINETLSVKEAKHKETINQLQQQHHGDARRSRVCRVLQLQRQEGGATRRCE